MLGNASAWGKRQRTPKQYWDVRKVAIYVAVRIADCGCAAMAREIGMHRDTVTSQCEEVRQRAGADAMFARFLDQTEQYVRAQWAGQLAGLGAEVQAAQARNESLRTTRTPAPRRERPTDSGGFFRSNIKLMADPP